MSLDLQQPLQKNNSPFCIEVLDSKIFIPYKYILISRDNIRMQKSLCIPPEETDKPKQPEVWFISNKFSILFEEWSIYLLSADPPSDFLTISFAFWRWYGLPSLTTQTGPTQSSGHHNETAKFGNLQKTEAKTLVLIKLELYTKDMIGSWVGG